MRLTGICKIVAAGMAAVIMMAAPSAIRAQRRRNGTDGGGCAETAPASVFYRGSRPTTQLRNSGGVKFADGFYVLATLVDTSVTQRPGG